MEIETFCAPLIEAGVNAKLTKDFKTNCLLLQLTIANAKVCGVEAYMAMHNSWCDPVSAQLSGVLIDQIVS